MVLTPEIAPEDMEIFDTCDRDTVPPTGPTM
jgi:hypothetical protein